MLKLFMDSALVSRALRTLPIIHQQHWPKAVLGMHRLRKFLPHIEEQSWQKLLKRVKWDEQPYVNGPISASIEEPVPQSKDRVLRQLQRGLVPSVYKSGVRWIQSEGFEKALDCFKSEVIESPGYLGHALSVLLGFREIHPFVKNSLDKIILYERFLEFCSSSLFHKTSLNIEAFDQACSFEEVLESCVQRPTFFGHHLIALAYLDRNKDWFGSQYEMACRSLYELSKRDFKDPEDNVVIDFQQNPKPDSFEKELEGLLFAGPADVHAITLSDSLVYLFQKTADERLSRIARHFAD